MSTHTVNINDIDLVYEKEGIGPPVVFIHGGNSCAEQWAAIIPHFMDHYTCVSLNQSGHGPSGRAPDGRYNMLRFAEECVGFLDAVTGPAVVVGQSSGGATAMGAAALQPELVRAIYLEDSVPPIYGARGFTSTRVPAFFGALAPVARKREREGLTIAQHAHNIGNLPAGSKRLLDVWSPTTLEWFARMNFRTDPRYYPEVANGRLAYPDDFCDAMPSRVKCPVHLGYGDIAAGGVVSLEAVEALRTGVRLTATHFPGGPHNIAQAFAREFINDLKAFLERLPA